MLMDYHVPCVHYTLDLAPWTLYPSRERAFGADDMCYDASHLLSANLPRRCYRWMKNQLKVRLMTTGKGIPCPLLAQSLPRGKVCLSLLGTWKGPGWDPKKSSILQVLVSIQSLVFVERPQ